MSGEEIVVQAEGLHKSYGKSKAVDGLSFEVCRGSIYGLLGPNGSGKTTTLKLLLGLLRPDKGTSSIFSEPSRELSWRCRQRIGWLSEEKFPYDKLPLPDLLKFVSAFFEKWDWDYSRKLVEKFDVPTDRPLRSLSYGERRKAELLTVLAQQPDLLILDDPAIGLDTTVRREFLWAALEVAADKNCTVLFTSHILTDVERIVDSVGLMRRGKMYRSGALDELKARTKRLVFRNMEEIVTLTTARPLVAGEVSRRLVGSDLLVVTEDFDSEQFEALRAVGMRVEVEDLALEDIYCELIGDGKKE
jgi:ABC-2 type transport system ATP-binding protein